MRVAHCVKRPHARHTVRTYTSIIMTSPTFDLNLSRELQQVMSAEPGRTAPYANDLRWRVVWQHVALELPFRNIANNLSISVGTAYNIFKRFEDTGEVDPKPATKRESLRKLDSHHRLYVISLIMSSPDLHLSELVS